MSQEESSKPKCPTRPPRPDPSKLRGLRLSRLSHVDEEPEICTSSPESENIPIYIDVLSDKSQAKDGAPASPPTESSLPQGTETQDASPASPPTLLQRKSSLSQSTETQDAAPASPPTLLLRRSSLSQSTETQDAAPARPPPPSVLRKSSFSQSTETQDACPASPPTLLLRKSSLSQSTETQDAAPARPPPPSVLRKSSFSQSTETQDASPASPPTTLLRKSSLSQSTETQDAAPASPPTLLLRRSSLSQSTETQDAAPARPPLPSVLRKSSFSQSTETQDACPASPPTTLLRKSSLSQSTETQDAAPASPPTLLLRKSSLSQSTEIHDGAPASPPPPPVLRESSLSQSTDTHDACPASPPNLLLRKSSQSKETQDATPARPPPPPLKKSSLSQSTETQKNVPPPRPPPPVLKKTFLSQSTDTQDLNGHTETSDIKSTETSSQSGSSETATLDSSTYADVPRNERRVTNHTTPVNTTPSRPVVPSWLSMQQPRKALLCHSYSADPTQHVYESIDDILSQDEDGVKGSPRGLTRKGRCSTFHTYIERSSVYGDSNSRELVLLLDWWRSIGGLENLRVDNQEEGAVTRPLISVAQRVKTAMRLYVLLLGQRCTDLLNHITDLHCTADSLVKSGKKTRVAKLTGGTTGAVGGVAIAAGLALAPITLGASLVATGVGIGIVAAGGVTGASASFTKKKKGIRLKDKVEKIINSYELQIEDILACLRFIDIGLDHLRKQDDEKLTELGANLERIAKVGKEMENMNSVDVIGDCFSILHGLDFYLLEEDDSGDRSTSNSQLAQKVHEAADDLKECMDQLIRIKNLFHSVEDDV